MRVYFDNAATTPLEPEVFEAMKPYLIEVHGNPSSIHAHGREARSAVEKARKQIAAGLNASPSEIFFTSGGTEADNTAIRGAIEMFDLENAITSPMEHHAVLHTLEYLKEQGCIHLHYVRHNEGGEIDQQHLEDLLKNNSKALVSLMHGNNEVGNINDIETIGHICRDYGAIYHSDTVQTIAHLPLDVQKLPVDYLVGAAHKFHGPKGAGFLYVRKDRKIPPLIHGGGQEREMRGGTENVAGIVGLSKAFQIARENREKNEKNLLALKQYMIDNLRETIPGVEFNGLSGYMEKSIPTVLNVRFPPTDDADMLLFNLDIQKISVSGGSACSSGASKGSHVLEALNVPSDKGTVRFSFSKYNRKEEIDFVIAKLKEIITVQA